MGGGRFSFTLTTYLLSKEKKYQTSYIYIYDIVRILSQVKKKLRNEMKKTEL